MRAKHRAELYEARQANKSLNVLVKKHVQQESRQILEDKRKLNQLLSTQAEEIKEFVRLVRLIYPKFDGFDQFLHASRSRWSLGVS